MTLEIAFAIFAAVQVLTITGGTIGVASVVLWLTRQHRTDLEKQLSEQAEAYKIEMRELDRYNSAERERLEKRIVELESEIKKLTDQRMYDWEVLRKILAERGIPIPKTGPLVSVTAGGDAKFGGDLVGRDKTGG